MPDALTPAKAKALPKHHIFIRRRWLRKAALTVYQRVGFDYLPVYKAKVALGVRNHPTPTGPAVVFKKEAPPTYTAPNEPWAREAGYTPGEKLPPDHPANPLRGAFLWITEDGVGIHGTSNTASLGTYASHGCVRVAPDVAMYLYEHIEVGTPVSIV
jgi:lipoprotein-anchoring transpeptidase ErfK/SrfK